ncbi:MAG: sialidase family protein [Planctomycetota bacterium]|nr:sialidase family protein [Planctomycetota bacterium]MDA1212800.1 sialidase family protein [Planctomycetota bacterium]
MQIKERGILNRGEPGTCRAFSTYPTTTVLSDGSLLATYRVGSKKDGDDEKVELRRSSDGGRTWSEPESPFADTINGKRGSLKTVYLTPLGGNHIMASSLWIDREAYPGKNLFNDQTEGCLPMALLVADSHDQGQSWSPWRIVAVPDDIGPPSLTSPVLKMKSGRLAVSIETNKNYEDTSKWFQRVVYVYSDDNGQTWGEPVTVSQDPTARIFNWDQRAGVCPDGRVVTFSWTYDRETTKYLNITRRISSDEGATWTEPEDLGFPDQASVPAILPDGRMVLAWVDRFHTHSIRARLARQPDAPFTAESEAVLYELKTTSKTVEGEGHTGDLLVEMGMWNYGLPFATALPDGDVLVTYYEGTADCMQATWVRLGL